jgi:hypothetical protein
MSATAPIQNQIDLAHIFLVWQEEGTWLPVDIRTPCPRLWCRRADRFYHSFRLSWFLSVLKFTCRFLHVRFWSSGSKPILFVNGALYLGKVLISVVQRVVYACHLKCVTCLYFFELLLHRDFANAHDIHRIEAELKTSFLWCENVMWRIYIATCFYLRS